MTLIGEKAYEMRMKGLEWTVIGESLGVRPNTALGNAKKYAQTNGLPLTIKNYKNTNKLAATARKSSTKGDAARWHKMHCGKGLLAEKIAQIEGVSVETVRNTLQAYREKMWGSS